MGGLKPCATRARSAADRDDANDEQHDQRKHRDTDATPRASERLPDFLVQVAVLRRRLPDHGAVAEPPQPKPMPFVPDRQVVSRPSPARSHRPGGNARRRAAPYGESRPRFDSAILPAVTEIATARAVRPEGAPLGFWMAVALVMGNMVGSGVFLLPASLAPFGAISLAGWLVSRLAQCCWRWSLRDCPHRIRQPADPTPTLARRLASWLVSGRLGLLDFHLVYERSARGRVRRLSRSVFSSLVRNQASGAGLAIAVVWLLTVVNLRGVRTAGVVQVTTTVLKVLPLVFVGIGRTVCDDPGNFLVADTSPWGDRTRRHRTATLTLWAFLGLECATIPAGSIRNPEHTIPRATVIGTLVAAVIYILGTVAVMGSVSSTVLGQTTAPYAEAARALAGDRAARHRCDRGGDFLLWRLNGWILIVGQLPLAVAEDGLFPSIFRRRSRSGAPVVGLLVGGVLSSAMIAMNYTRGLVSLFTFVICCRHSAR